MWDSPWYCSLQLWWLCVTDLSWSYWRLPWKGAWLGSSFACWPSPVLGFACGRRAWLAWWVGVFPCDWLLSVIVCVLSVSSWSYRTSDLEVMRAIAATRQQSYFFFVISMKSQGFSFHAWDGDSASRPSMGIWLIGATGARPVVCKEL